MQCITSISYVKISINYSPAYWKMSCYRKVRLRKSPELRHQCRQPHHPLPFISELGLTPSQMEQGVYRLVSSC